MLGEYEPCKECLEEFKSFIVENKLNEQEIHYCCSMGILLRSGSK